MLLGMTRGEILLIAFIFALVYGAGHLPKLAASLGGKAKRND
ncbi:MAG TPA: twin-arginine translocase TatA/TatE family subunit [Labilithrix sp.]|nr:twin-arginine translocase TatA/TatE family subunit [Labilithrix sp.]